MSDWNPELYLKFKKERNQPIYDLISGVEISNVKRIIDIGCGPGNSTAMLKEKWPEAEIIGIDFSDSMIEKAKTDYPDIQFAVGDASKDLAYLGKFDIVFANASLQWIPDHESLLPRLFKLVSSNGAFAAQIPQFDNMPISRTIRMTAALPKWKDYFVEFKEPLTFCPDEQYYNFLSADCSKIRIWNTKYYHVMSSHFDILEMISSTGMKPYLDKLPSELHQEFSNDILEGIKKDYPTQSDSKVLFPFERFFFIAYR